jgi:hypothetical protein
LSLTVPYTTLRRVCWRYQRGNQMSVSCIRAVNTMTNRKRTKGQTTIYKTYAWNWNTVHGHKYSSPSIFLILFHIKPHCFKKIVWSYLWADFYEIYYKTCRILWILFAYLIVIYVCMVFVFWWFKHKLLFLLKYCKFDFRKKKLSLNHKKIKAI